MNKKVEEIYLLLTEPGKDGTTHDVTSLKKAKRKISQLATKKNKTDLGADGEHLLKPETLSYLENLIYTYSNHERKNDENFDPLIGGSFWEDPVMLKKYIDDVPNFIEDLAKHFRICNAKYWKAFDKPKNNGKKSKRKTDSIIMESAKDSILKYRSSINNTIPNLKDSITQDRLFKEMKKRGFVGSLGWVKKHFATITKLA